MSSITVVMYLITEMIHRLQPTILERTEQFALVRYARTKNLLPNTSCVVVVQSILEKEYSPVHFVLSVPRYADPPEEQKDWMLIYAMDIWQTIQEVFVSTDPIALKLTWLMIVCHVKAANNMQSKKVNTVKCSEADVEPKEISYREFYPCSLFLPL
jgi:hypothetical protein